MPSPRQGLDLQLMPTLLLLAALVGPVDASPSVTHQQADRTVSEVTAIGIAYSGDLLTTGWALSRCPTCREANWLGPNPESRMALKSGMLFAQAGTVWLLESHGKHDIALGLTIGSCLVSAFAIVNNSIHAARRR